jgi:hypothetical protein
LARLESRKQKEWFLDNLKFRNMDITKLELFPVEGLEVPKTGFDMDFSIPEFSRIQSKRMFLHLEKLSYPTYLNFSGSNRNTDIHINFGYVHNDTVKIYLPGNTHPEYIPEDISISCELGEYSRTVNLKGNTLTYYRRFSLFDGMYDAEMYREFKKFTEKVEEADNEVLVLMNDT